MVTLFVVLNVAGLIPGDWCVDEDAIFLLIEASREFAVLVATLEEVPFFFWVCFSCDFAVFEVILYCFETLSERRMLPEL